MWLKELMCQTISRDLESLRIICLLVRCPPWAQPRRVKLETWPPRNAPLLRGCGQSAFRQSLWLGSHHERQGQCVLYIGRLSFPPAPQGLSWSITKKKINSLSDPSASSVLFEFAIFRSIIVIKEVSAQVRSSLGLRYTNLWCHIPVSLEIWANTAQKHSFRGKKEHSTVVISCTWPNLLSLTVYLLLTWAERVEFSRISFPSGGPRKKS